MSEPLLVPDLLLVVPACSRCVGGLHGEAGDGHRREEGASAEDEQVEQVLVVDQWALLVPVSCGDPEDKAKGGCSCN